MVFDSNYYRFSERAESKVMDPIVRDVNGYFRREGFVCLQERIFVEGKGQSAQKMGEDVLIIEKHTIQNGVLYIVDVTNAGFQKENLSFCLAFQKWG